MTKRSGTESLQRRVRAGLRPIILALAALGASASAARPAAGLMDGIERDHVIRAGYGLLPPYTQEDPATRKVYGATADILNEIGRQLGVPVVWKRFKFGDEKAAFDRGDFNVVGEAVFETMARARDYTFTEPFSFFPICVGVVRSGERRFARFDETNSPAIHVAVGAGTIEQAFLEARSPMASAASVAASPGSSAAIALVLSGAADIALIGRKDARTFVRDHPGQVRILWEDNPPGHVPAGFTLRAGDVRGAQFLNAALQNLRSTGVLSAIADRYNLGGAFREAAVPRDSPVTDGPANDGAPRSDLKNRVMNESSRRTLGE